MNVLAQEACLLSPEDEDLRDYSLSFNCDLYVQCREGRVSCVVMRRVLGSEIPAGLDVDHINGIKHDNRRENLRLLSRSDNVLCAKRSRNSTGYMRVELRAERKRPYIASIRIAGKQTHLGHFATAAEAAWIADVWAVRTLSEHAQLNFPECLAELFADAMKLDINYPWIRPQPEPTDVSCK